MWRLLCALFCFVMLLPASFSQNLRLEKVNAENFPELQVFIHDRNPESTDNANIILSENTQKLNAEDYKISYSQKDYQFRQLTFILFENSFWDSYNKQRDYFKKVLDDALSSFSEEDDLLFAQFDWTNNEGKAIWAEKIKQGNYEAISTHLAAVDKPAKSSRKHQFSEINTALIDALEYLHGLEVDSMITKSIIILSGEVSNIHNPQFSQGDVILSAKQKNIPVYAVRYPRMSDKYTLKKVCDETYGKHTRADTENPEKTADALTDCIKNISLRASGTLFTLEYETSAGPGGKVVELVFSDKSSKNSDSIVFNTVLWFEWLMLSTVRLVSFIAIILAIILISLFVFIRSKRKREEERMEQDEKMNKLKEEQDKIKAENEKALQKQKEDFDLKQMEQERLHLKNAADKELRIKNEASQKRFLNRNRPCALIDNMGNSIVISQRAFSIGRTEGNDLIINKNTVSKKHAVILFEKKSEQAEPMENGLFFLKDLGSSNGTFINNKRVHNAVELKDGDRILVGDITITFRA